MLQWNQGAYQTLPFDRKNDNFETLMYMTLTGELQQQQNSFRKNDCL